MVEVECWQKWVGKKIWCDEEGMVTTTIQDDLLWRGTEKWGSSRKRIGIEGGLCFFILFFKWEIFVCWCDNLLEKERLKMEKRGNTWKQKGGGIQITSRGWALKQIHVGKDEGKLVDVTVGIQRQSGLTASWAWSHEDWNVTNGKVLFTGKNGRWKYD